MTIEQPQMIMEGVSDAVALEQTREQDARFARNWAWFEAHAAEIYAAHRGKCICVAGGDLFVAETPEEALAMATAAHSNDDGRLCVSYPSKG